MTYIGKHKTLKQIKQLVLQQAARSNWIDGCMLAFSGFGYFSLLELSLINVNDLVKENGNIVDHFVMPERITGGKGRLVNIGKKGFIVLCINNAIEYRQENDLDLVTNTGLYECLNPDSRFFVNDSGVEFKLNKIKKNWQPYALRRHMSKLNLGEGVSIKSLQESFIANVWNSSRDKGVGDVDILKSLRTITGLHTSTLRPKVIRRDDVTVDFVKDLYGTL